MNNTTFLRIAKSVDKNGDSIFNLHVGKPTNITVNGVTVYGNVSDDRWRYGRDAHPNKRWVSPLFEEQDIQLLFQDGEA